MQKFVYLFSTFLIVISQMLFAIIIETAHFSDIVPYANSKTLILLDIDDTLLLPTQTLGSDIWFQYRFKQNLDKGLSNPLALEKAIADWEAIRMLSDVKVVEECIPNIIKNLQSKNVNLMGLTTQGLALATCTVNQLNSLQIDLSKTAPSSCDHYFINKHGVLFRKGILFTSGTPKGDALLKLFNITGICPERIVFINDKAAHLKDVEDAVTAKGFQFIGLRYNYGDARVAQFSKEIADIQWSCSTFEHILSDGEAATLLKSSLLESRM